MDHELDYIISAYSALRLNGGSQNENGPSIGSPLKAISLNHSPSKLKDISPGKRKSAIIKGSPTDIYKLCWDAIELGTQRLNKLNEVSNSLVRLISSSFSQIYKLSLADETDETVKKHQAFIVRLIDLESSSLGFKYSSKELVNMFISNYCSSSAIPKNLTITDLLGRECPITLKFLVLQIIFKRFHQQKYDTDDVEKILQFFLQSSSYSDSLTHNQKTVFIKLILSLSKFAPSLQFRHCVNLRFLQLLEQFSLPFSLFITNISKNTFIDDLAKGLMTLEQLDMVPFFLFDYAMNDRTQTLAKVTEHYQKILSGNKEYDQIEWKLVNSDTGSCEKLLKVLKMKSLNSEILWSELMNLGRPNVAIIEGLGDFIAGNLSQPDAAIEQVIRYYVENIIQLDKSILKVLDRIVISFQHLVSPPDFLGRSLLLLGELFSKHKQIKRLKNVSNLFYNFASKASDKTRMRDYVNQCLQLELVLFRNHPATSDLSNKFDRCLRLLKANSIPITESFNIIFNEENLQSFESSNLLLVIDLVDQRLAVPIAFSNLLELDLQGLSEKNRAIVFSLSTKYSTGDLSSFFLTLDIREPILKMLCGTYYSQLPVIRPQSQSSQSHKASAVNATNADSLIRASYYLVQESKARLTINLRKILQLYTQGWLPKSKSSPSSFEFKFLEKAVKYLKFVNFQKSLKSLLAAVEKYKLFGISKLNRWIDFHQIENQVALGDISNISVSSFDSTISSMHSESSVDDLIYVLNYQCLKLKYFMLTYDTENLTQVSDDMVKTVNQNEAALSIDNRLGHSSAKFVEILLLLVKLHHSRAKTLSLFGEHLESLLSFCNVIRLSKSILKKCSDELDIITLISSSFRCMVKTLIHLGISKDAAYYSSELANFNQSISRNRSVFCQNCFFLSYYYYVIGEVESCNTVRQKANVGFESLNLIVDNQYVDNYKLIYYKILSDIYSLSAEDLQKAREKVGDFLSFMDKDAKTLSIAWRLNFEYIFSTDVSLKNTKNPYVTSMDLMITARKLFIDAQKCLNTDPLFSTLEDSAMSIPSINKEKEINIGSQNKIKNLKNLKKSILNLKQSKDISLSLFKELRYLSNYHINEFHKVLSLDLLTLSSISNSYNNESIEDSYKLNDFLKNQPLFNEKLMIKITDQEAKNRLPTPDFRLRELDFAMPDLDQASVNSEILEKLPEDWLVVTIDICSFNGDLIITNFDKGSKIPSLLRLPISRHSSRVFDEESFSFKNAIDELNSIISKSKSTITEERTSSIHTSEDRKAWHEERFELDQSLKDLLTKIEYCWIGGFKGIFSQEIISDETVRFFKQKFLNIISQNIPSRSQRNHGNGPVEIDDFVVKLFLKLGDPSKLLNTELLEDLIYFVLDILLFHGEENAYDEIDIDNIYVEVENLINEYIQCNEAPKKNKYTVLVLGKECLLLPWESLPCLRDTSTTRMPSLSHLLKLFDQNPQLYANKRNGSFILNPLGDLVKTEERLRDGLEQTSKDYNWTGIIGERPTEDEFETCLDSNVFVYVGHGGGENFIRSSTLKKRNSIAPTLLLGCSSASLKNNNLLEPSGTVYSYLIGGCPMIVGNLWDVTDKDIDKFSVSLFEKWGLLNKEGTRDATNICDAVRLSRDSCNLKYLNGAAPVVYGLPLSLL